MNEIEIITDENLNESGFATIKNYKVRVETTFQNVTLEINLLDTTSRIITIFIPSVCESDSISITDGGNAVLLERLCINGVFQDTEHSICFNGVEII